MSDIDFETRVRNNGVKVKNVPNARTEEGKFLFGDYVAKNVSSWAYVPDVDSEEEGEEYAREVAENMYEIYGRLAENVEEVELTREEDEMYWADVVVDIPDDPARAERVAEEVAEAILARQQL